MHKPQLIPFSQDAAEAPQIRALNEDVFARPPEYQRAVRELRKHAMSGQVDISPEHDVNLPLDTEATPYDMLRSYLANRLDRRSDFDEQTERRIAQTAQMKALLKQHVTAKSSVIKHGSMKSELRENPNAIPIRDQIRLLRLGSYVTMVAAYVKQEETKTSVAS